MKYTSNIIKRFRFAENTDKQGGGIMKSQFASEFTILKAILKVRQQKPLIKVILMKSWNIQAKIF